MLTSLLPQPKNSYASYPKEVQRPVVTTESNSQIPPYGQRKGWVPRKPEDFGDGGAFPEIHVAQYPLGLGKQKQETNSVIPLTFDANGKIKFDAVLGRTDKKVVYSSSKDLIPHQSEVEKIRPTEEEELETTQRTKLALEKILNGKITASHPSKPAENNREVTYFQYNPTSDGATPNAGSKQRIIKLVEVPQDPLEPPKFKHKKVVRGPGSPPAPILHSPSRKLTQQDVEDWNIPSCISNWKNQKGYTISLDKRLAADGRGLQKPQINDKFAIFSESLYIAERNAREMVENRLKIKEKILQNQKKQQEDALTELAKNARLERSKLANDSSDEEDDEKAERDRIREERRKQTEREMRLENNYSSKKKKRDEDRDISEAIALGKSVSKPSGEGMFDQRLFNQSQGIDQGFGADDSYNVYDKPLFHGSAATQLFKPKKSEIDPYTTEEDLEKLKKGASKFRPDKGFAGTESDKPIQPRNKPVQFEKDEFNDDDEIDEFGIDEFMNDAKRSKAILPESRNTLHAATSSSGDILSSNRSSINFTAQSSVSTNSSSSSSFKSYESKTSSNYKLADKFTNKSPVHSRKRSRSRSKSYSPRRNRDHRDRDRYDERDRRDRDRYRDSRDKRDRYDRDHSSERRRRDDDRKRRKYDD